MSTALPTRMPCATSLLRNRYRSVKEIGIGGYSRVMQAMDMHEERVVAVKQLSLHRLDLAERAMAKEMFMQEARMLAQLRHPRIPRLIDEWTETMPWALVMDFIDGVTLETYLAERGGRLPLEEILTIGLQLCEVLSYLHTQNLPIVFRDLKLANVLRRPEGDLFLIDFGLASRYRQGQAERLALGTPGYAAPEQYPDSRGNTYPTPLSDIYGLGAMLHYLLSGSEPTRLQRSFRFPSLSSAGLSASSAPLVKLIDAMLERDAAKRPQDVAEVVAVLQQMHGAKA